MGYEQPLFSSSFGVFILIIAVVLAILLAYLLFVISEIKAKLNQHTDSIHKIHRQLAKLDGEDSSSPLSTQTSTQTRETQTLIDFEVESATTPPPPGVRSCPVCGKRNSKANLVCAHCGVELTPQSRS
jgi:cytoskeletal protein RodZ